MNVTGRVVAARRPPDRRPAGIVAANLRATPPYAEAPVGVAA